MASQFLLGTTMKNRFQNRLTCSNGLVGTYAWLMRELAHHPYRFTINDVPWFIQNQPRHDPRWRLILLIRELGATNRLPDDQLQLILCGCPVVLDGVEYTYDGVLLEQIGS